MGRHGTDAWLQTDREVGVIPDDKVKLLAKPVDFLDGRWRPVKDSVRAKMHGDIPHDGASGIVDYANDFLSTRTDSARGGW